MRRSSVLFVHSILAVLFAGCPVESVNTLSNLSDSNHDEQLTGAWVSKGEGGEAWYLHIGKGDLEFGPNVQSIAPAHTISVRHQPDGRIWLGTFKIFPTQIGEQNYASIKVAGVKESGLDYLLVKYSIDQNQKLSLWFIDEKITRDGKLNYSRSKVSDSTANLRAGLASPNHEGLFPPEPDFVFEKSAAK